MHQVNLTGISMFSSAGTAEEPCKCISLQFNSVSIIALYKLNIPTGSQEILDWHTASLL